MSAKELEPFGTRVVCKGTSAPKAPRIRSRFQRVGSPPGISDGRYSSLLSMVMNHPPITTKVMLRITHSTVLSPSSKQVKAGLSSKEDRDEAVGIWCVKIGDYLVI